MTEGLHHITGICGPAQQNVDFYAGFLGLRFVKRTVNFDDPTTYHLYYGDKVGSPGSIMTFFPWANAAPGRAGAGTVSEVAYVVEDNAIDAWQLIFADAGFNFETEVERFGDRVLGFRDDDGLALALVGSARGEAAAGQGDPTGSLRGPRSFFGVTLGIADPGPTARVLTEILGYSETGEEGGRVRFRLPEGTTASVVDLQQTDDRPRTGAGSIHHIAFRARDSEHQLALREQVMSAGLHVTDVKDRNYFESIYFREPGGVLFEIATDGPGFTVDEEEDALGTTLKLPAWFEDRRDFIESRLARLSVPAEKVR